jgi:hypothetical protein
MVDVVSDDCLPALAQMHMAHRLFTRLVKFASVSTVARLLLCAFNTKRAYRSVELTHLKILSATHFAQRKYFLEPIHVRLDCCFGSAEWVINDLGRADLKYRCFAAPQICGAR